MQVFRLIGVVFLFFKTCKMDELEWYNVIGWTLGVLTFLGIWIFAFIAWGFLIGLAIGWLPGIVAGVLMRWLWPLFALLILGAAALFALGWLLFN